MENPEPKKKKNLNKILDRIVPVSRKRYKKEVGALSEQLLELTFRIQESYGNIVTTLEGFEAANNKHVKMEATLMNEIEMLKKGKETANNKKDTNGTRDMYQ